MMPLRSQRSQQQKERRTHLLHGDTTTLRQSLCYSCQAGVLGKSYGIRTRGVTLSATLLLLATGQVLGTVKSS